ncbi:phragmoplastin interacting protein 1 [Euphorbia peplus]|nr:phragmoplastin interacting protein 1 [Euphorbia peplus]
MVLSNKKLKQKLREAKGESLAANEFSQLIPKRKVSDLANSRLQELLEAAKHKGNLTKREKRRKILPFKESGPENNGGNDEDEVVEAASEDDDNHVEKIEKKNKERKRKREDEENGEKGEDGEKGLVADGVVKKVKKAKKKKKKKKKTAAKIAEKVNVEAEEVAQVPEIIIQSVTNEDAATKIYVGGIPYYSTEDDIRSFFEGCGTITEIDCMKFPDSGKFRGIAIINFKTDAAAKRGLALDGSDMGGFFLKIQPYKTTRANKVPDFTPQVVEGYNRIYVGNLSWDITEEDLKLFFSECNISSIRWGTDKETGVFRGYGHVDFSDKPSLLKALKLDQQIVCGRPIKISCAVPKGAKIQAAAAPVATINEAENDGLDTNAPPPTAAENEEAVNGDLSAITGKIRRRTCYECGEKGHISSLCPKKQIVETSSEVPAVKINEAENNGWYAYAPALTDTGTEKEAENGDSSAINGKIRRRTCYECGEKGHISSLCPKKQIVETSSEVPAVKINEAENNGWYAYAPALAVTGTEKEAENGDSSAINGKIKRRTCYECGEKGHVSSLCPKKQIVETSSEVPAVTINEAENNRWDTNAPAPAATGIETEAENGGSSAISGKIRRRTCYECGEKGHISSLCPKKQSAETSSAAS